MIARISRRRFLAGLGPGLASLRPSPAHAAPAAELIREAIAGGEIPGAVLHVRARGRVVHEEAFGQKRIEDGVALAPATSSPSRP